jgi:hypothetical protein
MLSSFSHLFSWVLKQGDVLEIRRWISIMCRAVIENSHRTRTRGTRDRCHEAEIFVCSASSRPPGKDEKVKRCLHICSLGKGYMPQCYFLFQQKAAGIVPVGASARLLGAVPSIPYDCI